MKKIILTIILLYGFNGIGQNIVDADLKKIKDVKGVNDYIKIEKSIQLKNGANELVNCNFDLLSEVEYFEYLKTDLNKISSIVDEACLNTKFTLKNKSTFRPTSVMMSYNKEKSNWSVLVYYTGQNDYGATKDGSSISFFDKDGKYIETL